MPAVLCVDVGSTFTKGVLVEVPGGSLIGTAGSPTTVGTDVMDGVDAVTAGLAAHGEPQEVLICSSAGGGLRLAVVGYEAEVTAEAGHRVGLSAGGRVVHVSRGPMTRDDVTALRGARPDLVLLVGGTDGGNADVLLHNADRLARSRVAVPLVVAGNAEVAPAVAALLAGTGRRFVVADNVLPRIGVVAPAAARDAIRDAFLRHVIGGKGLSRGRGFRDLVRALGHARTVEGDLGMRWNAGGIVEGARGGPLPLPPAAVEYAGRVAADPGYLAVSDADWRAEMRLAETAAVVAVRRHGRPPHSSERPRPLADVALVVGSGGVLRHAPDGLPSHVLRRVTDDHGGGWRVPDSARTCVDTAYLLFAVGLLADRHPGASSALAATLAATPRSG